MMYSYFRPSEISLLPFVNHMHCLSDVAKTNRMLNGDKHSAGAPGSQPGKDEATPQPGEEATILPPSQCINFYNASHHPASRSEK